MLCYNTDSSCEVWGVINNFKFTLICSNLESFISERLRTFTDCNVTSQYWKSFFCHDSGLFNSRQRLEVNKYKYFVLCTKLNFKAPVLEHLFF